MPHQADAVDGFPTSTEIEPDDVLAVEPEAESETTIFGLATAPVPRVIDATPELRLTYPHWSATHKYAVFFPLPAERDRKLGRSPNHPLYSPAPPTQGALLLLGFDD